jgi:hypothetical protein
MQTVAQTAELRETLSPDVWPTLQLVTKAKAKSVWQPAAGHQAGETDIV